MFCGQSRRQDDEVSTCLVQSVTALNATNHAAQHEWWSGRPGRGMPQRNPQVQTFLLVSSAARLQTVEFRWSDADNGECLSCHQNRFSDRVRSTVEPCSPEMVADHRHCRCFRAVIRRREQATQMSSCPEHFKVVARDKGSEDCDWTIFRTDGHEALAFRGQFSECWSGITYRSEERRVGKAGRDGG